MSDVERIEAWLSWLEAEAVDIEEAAEESSDALLAHGIVAIEDRTGESISEAEARAHAENVQLRDEIGKLRQAFRSVRAELGNTRQNHLETTSKAHARIASLERGRREMGEEIKGLRKGLAVLAKDLASGRCAS